MSDTEPYRYFVSYAHSRGFGRINFTRSHPITSVGELAWVENEIRSQTRDDSIVVLFWRQYDEADATREDAG